MNSKNAREASLDEVALLYFARYVNLSVFLEFSRRVGDM